MKIWQSNKHFFGWYYKKWFMYKIAKPLGLKCYAEWRHKKNIKKHGARKRLGERANPKWRKHAFARLSALNGAKCALCGVLDSILEVDHMIPLCISGKDGNKDENLQLLCNPCHTDKTRQENRKRSLSTD